MLKGPSLIIQCKRAIGYKKYFFTGAVKRGKDGEISKVVQTNVTMAEKSAPSAGQLYTQAEALKSVFLESLDDWNNRAQNK